jgi:hypothetical protein
MIDIKIFKDEYYSVLNKKKEQYKTKINELKKLERQDEAILVKVKLNVVDIFSTLFNTSYKKVIKTSNKPDEIFKDLGEVYLDFFDKIPAPWREKYSKAKERDLVLDYVIEEIKINTAEEIKQSFVELYDKQNIAG